MSIRCVHTAPRDVAVYKALFPAGTTLLHDVRPDLLKMAQTGHPDTASATATAMAAGQGADVTLCTCTTLAPYFTATDQQLNIVDPAAEQACAYGPDILVVLFSAAHRETLENALSCAANARHVAPRFVLCTSDTLIDTVRTATPADCILLAQASMHGQAHQLSDLNCPVLTTPGCAVAAACALTDQA